MIFASIRIRKKWCIGDFFNIWCYSQFPFHHPQFAEYCGHIWLFFW